VFVYLFEAHATDEWPLGDAVVINQHQTLDDRIAAAKLLQDKYHAECEIYVDSMGNAFNKAFFAWPERFYVLSMVKYDHEDGKASTLIPSFAHIAEPSLEDRGFNRDGIANHLDALAKRLQAVAELPMPPAADSS
jgi:hypothetical protein